MKKSIIDQFAADAINAPVAVTGGGGQKESKQKETNRGQEKKESREKRN
jgi:hypothetical protein